MVENKRFIQKNEAIINIMTDELVNASSEDSAKIIVGWLNEQEKRINDLKETIIKITHSYHQKHDNTIVNLVNEVYEEDIGDLFIELNYSGME